MLKVSEAVIDKRQGNSLDSSKIKGFLIEYGILAALILIVIALSIVSPAFLGIRNILNVLRQVSINGYLAVGLTFVILTGGIDLSVGSTVAFSGVMAATLAQNPENPTFIIVLAGLLVGLAVGIANGVLIARWNLAPFIVTLGMMSMIRGMTFVYSDGRPIPNLKVEFLEIGRGSFLGVPTPVIILGVVLLLAWFVLYKITFGRHVFAVGGNEQASLISGLNVRKVKIFVYGISGLLAGLTGVILTSRVTSGLPQSGQSYELDAIAAVVIGGTSLSGGKGKLWGTAVGFLLIGIINNGLDLLNVSSFYQLIVKGFIIILAVMLDRKATS